MATPNLPTFTNYGEYSSNNYGAHSLVFTDSRGNKFFFSYQTLVAFVGDHGLIVMRNYWKSTTGKHLNWIDGGTSEAKRKRLTSEQFEAAYRKEFPSKKP